MKYNEFKLIFPEILAKAERLCVQYKHEYHRLCEACESTATRVEYSKGTRTLHLGYYTPNPLIDRVIGGCRRGRLLKRVKPDSKYDWKYVFNNERLIYAEETGGNEEYEAYKRFLIYDYDEYIWELVFNPKGEIGDVYVWAYSDHKLQFEIAFGSGVSLDGGRTTSHASYVAWILEHSNDLIVEFEWFYDKIYPDKASEYYRSVGMMKYAESVVCRYIYKLDQISESGTARYNIFKCWGESDELIPNGMIEIKK